MTARTPVEKRGVSIPLRYPHHCAPDRIRNHPASVPETFEQVSPRSSVKLFCIMKKLKIMQISPIIHDHQMMFSSPVPKRYAGARISGYIGDVAPEQKPSPADHCIGFPLTRFFANWK